MFFVVCFEWVFVENIGNYMEMFINDIRILFLFFYEVVLKLYCYNFKLKLCKFLIK